MKWLGLFKFDIIGNKYKITYLGNEPLSVYISVKIVGVDCVLKTIRFKFTSKYHWFIPELDYRGCSVISFRNMETNEYMFDRLIDKKLSMTAKGQNIIGIGLNKTGTTSFAKSMENLGYVKFEEEKLFQFIQYDVYYGDYGKINSILNNPQFSLFQDKPFSYPKVYKKIYELRPNDLYVLTLRKDAQSWAKTCMRFWDCLQSSDFKNDKSFIHTIFSDNTERVLLNYLNPMFESWGLEILEDLEKKLIQIYENHKNECESFFEGKTNFISVEIEKKGEFKRLTDWLGIENSIEDFPWENKNHKGLHP
jgi:hypothetical protein